MPRIKGARVVTGGEKNPPPPPKGASASHNTKPDPSPKAEVKRGPSKFTPQARKAIIEILEVGGTWRMAAAAARVSEDTLLNWRKADSAFSAACACARDSGASDLVTKIREAAEGGDWRASAWLLERVSPEQYGRRVMVGGAPGAAPIQIDGELRVAGEIRGSIDASGKLHAAILSAAGTKR